MADYITASNFRLSGGKLSGKVVVKSYSGLDMSVEVSSTSVGNDKTGKKKLEPKPGPTKPGTPIFVCPIYKNDKTLAKWWEDFNPNAKVGTYKPDNLIFTLIDGDEVAAEWHLKGVFPMSYELSDGDSSSSEIATETIQLCVTEFERKE